MTLTEHYNTNDIEYGKMTDKSTIHDYIDGYYSDEFSSKKDDAVILCGRLFCLKSL